MRMKNPFYADLVLLNGKIITVDSEYTIAEAVAVQGEKIARVGSSQEIKAWIGSETNIIDLEGNTVCPGFIDTHIHFSGGVAELYQADIRTPPLKSINEILKVVEDKAKVTPKGNWILAAGSFSADFYIEEKRYPTKWEVDEVAPDHLVVLRFGAHITVANSRALELAGISKDTPQPIVGHIEKDPATGEPTGLFREGAARMVTSHVPPYTLDEIKKGLENLFERLLKEGLTTVHNMVNNPTEIRALQEMRLEDKIPIRIMYHPFTNHHAETCMRALESFSNLGLITGFGDNWLRLGGAKFFTDGGMTGRNAALYEPYEGEPDNYGMAYMTQDELNEVALRAHQSGLQLVIHAIGDKGTDMTLNAIEYALSQAPKEDSRPRIEHGGNNWCTPKRIERIKKLGVVLVPDPQFIWNIGDSYISFLGPKRTEHLFNFRTLLDKGVKMAWSTDGGGKFSVSPTDPILGLDCVVNRKTMLGNLINPDEKISMMEAIKFYTINSAFASYEEKIKGSIETGKLADMVILSEDPLTIDQDKIMDIEVLTTIVGGKIVYNKDE